MVRLRQGKNKRWRKGQSCESNPATRTHRDAAKRGAIVGHATRKSNLTVDALARHEEKHDEEDDVELKDDEGLSVKSGQTFGAFSVSGLTDCSNPVFATVRRFWDSPSSQHKEVSELKLTSYKRQHMYCKPEFCWPANFHLLATTGYELSQIYIL